MENITEFQDGTDPDIGKNRNATSAVLKARI
jgi:hypothetical protein